MENTMVKASAWQKYVPKSVDLYFVNYDDDLKGQLQLLQECISKNNFYPLSEKVYDFWDFSESEYLSEIEREMAADNLEGEYRKHEDDIIEAIREADESDPIKDLLGNTGKVSMFYSVAECDCRWVEMPFIEPNMVECPDVTAKKVCKLLKIAEGSEQAQKVFSVCENASYGGELRIYFEANIEDMIAGDPYGENKQDWKVIQFAGAFAVAVYNSNDGAGDFEYIDLEVELPFIRENLKVSETEKYSLENCFGMCSDWLDATDMPMFSFNEPQGDCPQIKRSLINECEKHFEEVFKNGGCSADDANYSRHRDVYYRNDFPCGNICPHCGRVWYD